MDGTYAPQSPDLSSFLSSPPKRQQPYSHNNPQHSNTSASYAPRSPVLPSFGNTHQNHNYNSYTLNQNVGLGFDGSGEFGGFLGSGGMQSGTSGEYMPPIPALPESHSFPPLPQEVQPGGGGNFHHQQQSQHNSNTISPYFSSHNARSTRNPNPTFDEYSPIKPQYPNPPQKNEYAYNDPPSNNMSSSRAPRIKGESSSSSSANLTAFPPSTSTPRKDPNPNKIEIKTKFPVARIKRIMQADEEVGKVAQVTPVAVSKALELFMIALVGGAADKAREKGSKKVGAGHLKMVVEGSEQFDFLAEIVGRVPEGQEKEGAGGEAGAGKRKKKEDSDSEMEEVPVEEKKPAKKGRARKKKGDDE